MRIRCTSISLPEKNKLSSWIESPLHLFMQRVFAWQKGWKHLNSMHCKVVIIGLVPKESLVFSGRKAWKWAQFKCRVWNTEVKCAGFHFQTYIRLSARFIRLKLHFKNQFVKWLSGSVINRAARGCGLTVMQSAASWRPVQEIRSGYDILVLFNVAVCICAAACVYACLGDRLSFLLTIFFL